MGWAHAGENVFTTRTSLHGVGGDGGFHRRLPTWSPHHTHEPRSPMSALESEGYVPAAVATVAIRALTGGAAKGMPIHCAASPSVVSSPCTKPPARHRKVLHYAAPLAADNTNTPVTFTVSDGAATAVAMTQQATSSDAREGSAMVPIKVSRGQREWVTHSESTTWRDKHQCPSCRNSWLQQQVYHLNEFHHAPPIGVARCCGACILHCRVCVCFAAAQAGEVCPHIVLELAGKRRRPRPCVRDAVSTLPPARNHGAFCPGRPPVPFHCILVAVQRPGERTVSAPFRPSMQAISNTR